MTLLDLAFTAASVPAIDVPDAAPPPGSEQVLMVLSWVFWIAGIAGIAGLIFVGIMMAISNRQGHGAPEFVAKLGWVIGGLIIVSAASGIVTLFLGF